MFRSILIVCTGNICRSPMAEQLLREQAAGRDIRVSSAGTGAMVGWQADEMARQVMQEHGHDIGAHRAQQITLPMLTASDLVLTLDQTHSDWINSRYPQFRGRVYKLLKWQKNMDVEDPYMRPKKAFERAYADCIRGVDDWLLKLA